MVGTMILGAPPPEVAALIERRRALGQDLYDEVWGGVYHMVPGPHPAHGIVQFALAELFGRLAGARQLTATGPFNVGEPGNFRVPDLGFHQQPPATLYVPTARLVVEVLSPDDETFAKFDFYAAHRVAEIIVADPATRTVRCWLRTGPAYDERPSSEVLGVAMADVQAAVAWPAS